MRQSMAKSMRRDLRRAVGIAAVERIQALDEGVGSVGHALNHLRTDVAGLARDHALFKKDAHTDCAAFRARSFWHRLRWLFTGQ